MNLHLLRIFATVVEQQSFSRAAEALEVSQPAVSKAVRELESQLEVVLLDRGGRQFQLSEPGKVLYEYARSIFSMERAATEAVQAFYALDRGKLTIGASTTIAAYWLPKYVAEFSRQYPAIQLQLMSGNTQHVAQWLLDCAVDVALVEGPVRDERLEVRPWQEEEMVIIASKASPLGRRPRLDAAVLGEPMWIMRERGSGSREVVERALAERDIGPHRQLEVGSNEGIVEMVAAGTGIGMVPLICVRDAMAVGRVVALHLPDDRITRMLHRLRLPRRPVSAAALAFEALIAN
ncbi:MAG: LysR family transcriptional regulator [Rhodocyclaceae bacterium]